MATGELALHMIARHGYAIERLKREMMAEGEQEHLAAFLAYDAANFLYVFLIASGTSVTAADRTIRDELYEAVLRVLATHRINAASFSLWPGAGHGEAQAG